MHKAQRLSLIPPYLFGEIARLKSQALAAGRDLVDLGIGDPDQPTPDAIIEKLGEYAEDPTTHRYDESANGRPEFLAAGARWFKTRFGVDLDPATEMVQVIGSKEGLAHMMWATIDPGDIALVPDPAYTVCKVNTLLAGGEPYEVPLTAENGFLPELDKIPAEIAQRAKIIYLNYPNNPTGAIATLEFFEKAVAWAKATDTLILHDCAYSEVCFDGYRAPSILEVPGAKDVAIEMHSMSKTFNMTGWRIGFAAGNPGRGEGAEHDQVQRRFQAVRGRGADGRVGAGERQQRRVAGDLIKKRRDVLVDGLNSLGWTLQKPKASFYVWVPVPQGHTSSTLFQAAAGGGGRTRHSRPWATASTATALCGCR